MQGSQALEGYFFARDGRIMIRATVEDLRTMRAVQHIEIEGPLAGGLLPLTNELARRVSPTARAFGTNNENAFRFYGQAMEAATAEAREHALESAIAADPAFAVGYRDQARMLAGTGAKDRALQVIQAGEQKHPNPIDGAELRYIAASISGSANDRIQALETLAHAAPSNAASFDDLGQAHFARRNFPEAVRNYQTATHLNPEEPNAWNQLGYALAWTRRLKRGSAGYRGVRKAGI